MVFNRLRELRLKDLGIKSMEELAERLGGDDAGWYQQRVQRLETGKTKLDDETAREISKKLNIPISLLFEEEQQYTQRQKMYLDRIKSLDEKEEQLLDKMFETFFADRNGDKE